MLSCRMRTARLLTLSGEGGLPNPRGVSTQPREGVCIGGGLHRGGLPSPGGGLPATWGSAQLRGGLPNPRGVCIQGVCIQWGSAQLRKGVCIWGVCIQGVCLTLGACIQGGLPNPWGTCIHGDWANPPPCEQNDTQMKKH